MTDLLADNVIAMIIELQDQRKSGLKSVQRCPFGDGPDPDNLWFQNPDILRSPPYFIRQLSRGP